MGALAAKASVLPDEIFLTAAQALANFVNEDDLAHGALYPQLDEIRTVSHAIAVAVAEKAFALGVASAQRPTDLAKAISESMYDPQY